LSNQEWIDAIHDGSYRKLNFKAWKALY
jgi:hypothetical protein